MPIGDFPESLSQAMLVGVVLVGGLGVLCVAAKGVQSLGGYGGFYFVCDHGKHRNAKRYNLGCNSFFLPSLSHFFQM